MKTTKRKSFVLYTSWKDCFELLDESEKAIMLMNLFDYHEGKEPNLNTKALQIAWSVIKPLLQMNQTKYEAQVERALINVEKRKADIGTTSSPSRVSNDNDNANENVNEDVNENKNTNNNINVPSSFIMEQYAKFAQRHHDSAF